MILPRFCSAATRRCSTSGRDDPTPAHRSVPIRRQICTGVPAASGWLHIAIAPGGQAIGAKVGISTDAAAAGGGAGSGAGAGGTTAGGGAGGGTGGAAASAGTAGGGGGAAGRTGAGGGAGVPVMLGARAMGPATAGPGAAAGSTAGDFAPAASCADRSCIGAHAASQSGKATTIAAIVAGRRPGFPPCDGGLLSNVGIPIPGVVRPEITISRSYMKQNAIPAAQSTGSSRARIAPHNWLAR